MNEKRTKKNLLCKKNQSALAYVEMKTESEILKTLQFYNKIYCICNSNSLFDIFKSEMSEMKREKMWSGRWKINFFMMKSWKYIELKLCHKNTHNFQLLTEFSIFIIMSQLFIIYYNIVDGKILIRKKLQTKLKLEKISIMWKFMFLPLTHTHPFFNTTSHILQMSSETTFNFHFVFFFATIFRDI